MEHDRTPLLIPKLFPRFQVALVSLQHCVVELLLVSCFEAARGYLGRNLVILNRAQKTTTPELAHSTPNFRTTLPFTHEELTTSDPGHQIEREPDTAGLH
ncbi:hypothetical protein AVEN_49416-1 [Araneus ventricosus]|uniref:Uncharacterized protein n=1 Tax=Araneus ventricosus TaxID=182803 RepID=A0A4Y2CNN2_ARAVE|nr:hypothetical protein AVEN_49416-1 [Araneus ventricosus]